VAHFVHLIEHKDRVAPSSAFYGLHNPAGHGANIGPPMALDFRFVTPPLSTSASITSGASAIRARK
jgi:hypothetical protein